MSRDIVNPITDEKGRERHPAWALIGASRVSSSGGAVLFESDIRHQHYVVVTLTTASRTRDLNRDWIYGEKKFVEVAMSEAQWASFVSTMNVGQGVPATLLRREDERNVPGMPYEPRLRESMAEVRGAADKYISRIREAFDTYANHKTVGNLRDLEATIKNATSNIAFTAKSLDEHAENVVQRARADIEAMVMHKAQQLGLEPGDITSSPIELTAGDVVEEPS
jgi:hypothetical protein